MQKPDNFFALLSQLFIFTAAPLFFIALSGCGIARHEPDIAIIYNKTASYHYPDRNPIIAIPGIMGSKLLYSPTDTVAWGAFEGGAADPSDADGARIIALPIGRQDRLSQMVDDVRPNGVLEQLRVSVAGIALNIEAYAGILATLGAGGYRDEALGMAGAIDYGNDHFTCFQFAYDWRRDNVENARRLHEFIEEKREYVHLEYKKRYGIDKKDIKFDLAAHSMGGLLVRYFLMYGSQDIPADNSLPQLTWEGAKYVERVIFVGPPNAGSVDAFLELMEGEQASPFLPFYPPAILGTFPSVYQLLPRTRHKSIVWEHDLEQVVDVYDPLLWDKMNWGLLSPEQQPVVEVLLPEISSAAQRRQQALHFLKLALDRARQFHRAIDRPAETPDGLQLILVAGDADKTNRTVSVSSGNSKIKIVKTGPGDSIVLRASALADERMGGNWKPTVQSPVDFHSVFFLPYDHMGLTKSTTFRDNVLFWLLEDAR